MWFGVITLFPDMFDAITGLGMTGRAVSQGLIR
jgi:tRNA (guanine37-N1)-methyltransferase